ncbi:MAG: NUDIX domain-containing protein [Bradyrhizobium sp.]|uniref:NUDIX domain-containing protein n=1 Tax=Bradyrhizobium sp. TaxID=376 RepID=UPI001D640CA1|nr:NUDIX domain-containing protein [Bradyrhizobium sp.]MBV9566341.1 NUDIX domain-containing protein [Bradyrhizobium sp.]
MPRQSAGLLMYRRQDGAAEVLLVHPGGPFWAKKDEGAWSIPKGLFDHGEEALAAARREFEEETGQAPPTGPFIALGVFKQAGGKLVHAWAVEGAFDLSAFRSNKFTMEWPPRSGRTAEFPEADRAAWFGRKQALTKITKGQRAVIEALFAKLENS